MAFKGAVRSMKKTPIDRAAPKDSSMTRPLYVVFGII